VSAKRLGSFKHILKFTYFITHLVCRHPGWNVCVVVKSVWNGVVLDFDRSFQTSKVQSRRGRRTSIENIRRRSQNGRIGKRLPALVLTFDLRGRCFLVRNSQFSETKGCSVLGAWTFVRNASQVRSFTLRSAAKVTDRKWHDIISRNKRSLRKRRKNCFL